MLISRGNRVKHILTLVLTLGTSAAAQARDLIWDTRLHKGYTVDEFVSERQGGEILVFGERHATKDNRGEREIIEHHTNQVRLLERLTAIKRETRIQTGMEFLTYDKQDAVDQFLADALPEEQFLKIVDWGATPFELYRQQILIPRQSGGRTLALNIPRALATHVAKKGPESLSAEERQSLPPIWERGRGDYFERFREAMAEHATPAQIENFFWAQSLWDDTMAWNALRNTDNKALTVILVGEFHVEYGQGLPDRLRRHGATKVTTLLQLETESVETEELERLTAPDSRYGERADYIWLHVIGPAHVKSGNLRAKTLPRAKFLAGSNWLQ